MTRRSASAAPSQRVRSAWPQGAGELGVELAGELRPALDGGDEGLAVGRSSAAAQPSGARARRRSSRRRRSRAAGGGSFGSGSTQFQPSCGTRMRTDSSRNRLARPGSNAEAGTPGALFAAFGPELQPEADPQGGAPGRRALAEGADQSPSAAELGGGRAKGPDARQHEALGPERTSSPSRSARLARPRGEAGEHAGQVRRPGGDDERALTACPWCSGSRRPTTATASRRAKASALNAASARWWSFSPRSTSTCRHDSPGDGEGVGRSGQVFVARRRSARGAGRGRPRAKGRPLRSQTARARASSRGA
jgi:hypothetical protein